VLFACDPLREAVVCLVVRPFGADFVPVRARAAVGFGFVVRAFVARPLDRVFAELVPDAAFDADADRERVAALLRVPLLDRLVLAMTSSKRVTPGGSLLPMRLWF
jgi:hypothetical protein